MVLTVRLGIWTETEHRLIDKWVYRSSRSPWSSLRLLALKNPNFGWYVCIYGTISILSMSHVDINCCSRGAFSPLFGSHHLACADYNQGEGFSAFPPHSYLTLALSRGRASSLVTTSSWVSKSFTAVFPRAFYVLGHWTKGLIEARQIGCSLKVSVAMIQHVLSRAALVQPEAVWVAGPALPNMAVCAKWWHWWAPAVSRLSWGLRATLSFFGRAEAWHHKSSTVPLLMS